AGLFEVVESATASDFPSARTGYRACRIGLYSARQGAGPILTPFHGVPFHVVQSPWIGQLLPDRVRRETTVQNVPRVIRQVCVSGIIAVAEARRSASARGALPLRLRWEPIMAVSRNAPCREFPLRQLRAVIGRVGPAHAGNR